MEELPLGFGMAEILAHTHTIQSRNEMHAYVQSLGNF